MQRRMRLPLMALTVTLGLAAGTVSSAHAQGIPKAPPFVVALPNNGAVLVTWGNVLNAVGYNIYRRTLDVERDKATLLNPQQPYPLSWLIDLGPDNRGLPNGVPLLYSVRAVFRDGDRLTEGPASREAVVTPQAPLLGGFFAYDIGTTNPSRLSLDGNILTVQASGVELWDGSDECTFIALPIAGDYTATVKLLDKPKGGHPASAKAGVMIREGLMPGDRYAFAMVMSGRGAYFEGRMTVWSGALGGEAVNFAHQGTNNDETTPPVWLRLVKRGAEISAFQSFDGTNYDPIGDVQDFGRMQAVTYVGLGLSAVHVNNPNYRYVTGQFDLSTLKIE